MPQVSSWVGTSGLHWTHRQWTSKGAEISGITHTVHAVHPWGGFWKVYWWHNRPPCPLKPWFSESPLELKHHPRESGKNPPPRLTEAKFLLLQQSSKKKQVSFEMSLMSGKQHSHWFNLVSLWLLIKSIILNDVQRLKRAIWGSDTSGGLFNLGQESWCIWLV